MSTVTAALALNDEYVAVILVAEPKLTPVTNPLSAELSTDAMAAFADTQLQLCVKSIAPPSLVKPIHLILIVPLTLMLAVVGFTMSDVTVAGLMVAVVFAENAP